MIREPLIPPGARAQMTNSGKYAHDGPGLAGCDTRFGGLRQCIEADCTGSALFSLSVWLEASNVRMDN